MERISAESVAIESVSSNCGCSEEQGREEETTTTTKNMALGRMRLRVGSTHYNGSSTNGNLSSPFIFSGACEPK